MNWSILIFAVVVFGSSGSAACASISSVSERGPAEWGGRSDIPANWVFVAARVPDDTGSWWYRKDGEPTLTRLNSEVNDESQLRIWPDVEFEAGQTYEVRSSHRDFDIDSISVDDFDGLVLDGQFTVVPRLETSPSPPTLLLARSEPAFRVPTVAECDQGASGFTVLSYVLAHEPANALYILRERESDKVVWETSPPLGADTALLTYETSLEGVHQLQIEIFDFAGASSSIEVVGDGGGPGGCSVARPTTLPVVLLLLGLFRFRFRLTRRNRNEGFCRSLTRG